MYTFLVFHTRGQNTVGGSLLRRPNGSFSSAAWSIFAPPLTLMRGDRQERISFLVRTNQGRHECHSVRQDLIQLLGTADAVQLLDLAVSDRLRRDFHQAFQQAVQGFRPSWHTTYSAEEKPVALQTTAEIAMRHDRDIHLFLTHYSEICGVIRLSADSLAAKAEELLRFDRDSIAIASMDGQNGLLLDWIPDDPMVTFDLVIWGLEWVRVAEGITVHK